MTTARTRCPACLSGEWEEIAPGGPFRLDACVSCGCERITQLDERSVAPSVLYGRDYYEARDARRLFGPFHAMWRWLRDRRARQVLFASAPGQRICDVGCERGDLLAYLRSRGRVVFGTQVSPTAGAHAVARGLDIYVGELEAAPFVPSTFDHILMLNVIEHLPDPDHYVHVAASLLRPGGRLWVEAPNIASLTARLAGKRWLHHDPEHHLWAFHERGLRKLLARHGLVVDRAEHLSLEYGPIGCIQSWLNALPPRPNVLFELVRRGPSQSPGGLVLQALQASLAILLAPFAIAITFLEAMIGSGQVILVVARKP